MSCNPNPPNPPSGKSQADMVAEMLTPDQTQVQPPIGDFRLTQWDEFAAFVQKVGKDPKDWSLPIQFLEHENDFRRVLRPGEDKYTATFYVMACLANLWESLQPDKQGMRYLCNFLDAVRTHIETYTIPRYATGCPQSDPLSKFILTDIDTQLTKYVTRYGRMERGDERVPDIMKMAHYYQIGWSLWSNQPEPQVEPAQDTKPVREQDADKSLSILWHRVRSLEERISVLESQPNITEAQKQIIDFHTPMSL